MAHFYACAVDPTSIFKVSFIEENIVPLIYGSYENINVEGFHGIVCVFFLVKIIKKGPSSRKGIRSGSFYTKSPSRDNEASKRNCDYYKAARRNYPARFLILGRTIFIDQIQSHTYA